MSAPRYRYFLHYEIYNPVTGVLICRGERFNASDALLTRNEDFDPIRAAIQAGAAGMPMPGDTISGNVDVANLGGRVVFTSVTLLATPNDQLDDEEWRQERAIAQLARNAAYAWSQLGRHDRTALGDMRPDLANAIDALTGAVNRPVTP